MTAGDEVSARAVWQAPRCPFVIEYSPRVLDDIRLAVADAFFSLPRGGAEIGGVLLGAYELGRLTISGYTPLECEHAFGPSFTLSPADERRLKALIEAPHPADARPVGWYHSHTRSGIFLSPADLEIHRRFFPESWQIAVVLRPHTLHPMRAGIFFREPDGSIQSESCYEELVLQPLPMKQVPSVEPAAAEPARISFVVEPDLPVVARTPEKPEAAAAPIPQEAPPAEAPAPPRRRLVLLKALAGLIAAAAIGIGAAYSLRDKWNPRAMAMLHEAVPAPPPTLGLNTIDSGGQLQIRWNRNSPAVLRATAGELAIGGGPARQRIPLEKAQLLSGVLTVARQTERVDVTLSVVEPRGGPVSESTMFLGSLPKASDNGNLSGQIEQMKSDLNAEIERNKKLRRSVDELQRALREQQRQRLANQDK
jgi:proteasome lid subunit RPN8/RPN11